MEVFVARQPIFNIKNEVFGYELLYRSSTAQNSYTAIDGDVASSWTVSNTLFNFGITHLTSGKKAFINFTKNLLDREVATLLPKDQVILEVLENIEPDRQVLNALINLKKIGFKIALDDFVFTPKYQPLVDLADIIKVDFLSGPASMKDISAYKTSPQVVFLAEKIETPRDFEKAKQLGYTLFQGYYFSKPVVLQSRKTEPQKLIYLQLLRDLNQPDLNFEVLTRLIERDLTLTYEILRIVNSAAYYRNYRIDSVKQALILLGVDELKKWAYLISLTKIGADHPPEVVTQSLLRAKFLELLGAGIDFRMRSPEIFLMGMVSMLDVLLDRPLEEVLNELSISEDVKDALLRGTGVFAGLYKLVIAYEKAEWDSVFPASFGLGLTVHEVAQCYFEALKWLEKCNTLE